MNNNNPQHHLDAENYFEIKVTKHFLLRPNERANLQNLIRSLPYLICSLFFSTKAKSLLWRGKTLYQFAALHRNISFISIQTMTREQW